MCMYACIFEFASVCVWVFVFLYVLQKDKQHCDVGDKIILNVHEVAETVSNLSGTVKNLDIKEVSGVSGCGRPCKIQENIHGN